MSSSAMDMHSANRVGADAANLLVSMMINRSRVIAKVLLQLHLLFNPSACPHLSASVGHLAKLVGQLLLLKRPSLTSFGISLPSMCHHSCRFALYFIPFPVFLCL